MPASDSGQGRFGSRTPEELQSQLGFLEDEVGELRRRLAESPMHSRAVEQRLAETQRSLAAVTSQNERLAQTLREARDQIMTLKEEVDRLAQPPAAGEHVDGVVLVAGQEGAEACLLYTSDAADD